MAKPRRDLAGFRPRASSAKVRVVAEMEAMSEPATQHASPPEFDVATSLRDVGRRMTAAAARAGRQPSGVSLVAVSKTVGDARLDAALAFGQRIFGENRVQEAQGKWPPYRARYSDLELHLIGPLQTNKAKDAVELFDVIETLDRPRLADALAKAMAATGRRPKCLVQVNTGEEPQKAGIPPGEADDFIAECRDRLGLPIVGLMCIPPAEDPPAPHFALLADIAKRNGLAVLSMGMSGDFETAIELGATHVRVGSAIFGHR